MLQVTKSERRAKAAKQKQKGKTSSPRQSIAINNIALFNYGILFHILSCLDECGMTTLTKTCKHFGSKSNSNNDNNFSLMDNIARQILNREIKDGKRATFICYFDESWIPVYQQFLIMGSPLVFCLLFGSPYSLYYIDGDTSRVGNTRRISTAICSQVMRGGKHIVTFCVEEDCSGFDFLCIIRPIKIVMGKGKAISTQYLASDNILLCVETTMVDGEEVMLIFTYMSILISDATLARGMNIRMTKLQHLM